jgi:mortality factor 4-like protein 1
MFLSAEAFVINGKKLVPLPRSPCVAEILQQFKEHVLSLPKRCFATHAYCFLFYSHFCSSSQLHQPAVVLPTIISGLQVYFDRSLGANLLYRFERPQYAEMRKEYVTGPKVVVGLEKEMSAIYGAEHLLRMMGSHFLPSLFRASSFNPIVPVVLPQMVANSTMDAESAGLVRDYVNELLT